MSIKTVLSWNSRDQVASDEFLAKAALPPAGRVLSWNTLQRVVRFASTFKRELTSPQRRRKLGLALGGGFARGMAHIGVMKVLEEENIPVDFVAGTSAGAIIGAAYCAGMSAGEMEGMALTARFRDFARWSLSRYGFYASDRMANFCEQVIKLKNFEDLRIPLAVTATDVRTGAAVIFTKGSLVDPMRASCAYPECFLPSKWTDAR